MGIGKKVLMEHYYIDEISEIFNAYGDIVKGGARDEVQYVDPRDFFGF